MITLHREKETDFTKNGYGMLDDLIFNESGKWELNGEFMISFEVPALTRFTEYFKVRNIIQAPVPYMDRQLFRIYRTEKTLQSIRVEARHIFYDLLDNWIEDTYIVGQFGNNAIQQLLRNTQYPHVFTGSSNIQQAANARVVRMNPVEALIDDGKDNSFVSRWGGELVRDNFFIEMLERIGTDRGVEIEHKKDLLGYEATIDISTVVTRIQPVGFDGLMLPERYVDSPLIDPEHPIIAEIKYRDIKAAVGEYEDDEDAVPLEQAYDMLREAAKNEFESNHIDEPETVVNVDFVALHNTEQYKEFEQLQEVKAGDTVKVNVYDHVFEITSRLIAFDFSILKENHYTSITLGNHVYEFTSSGVDVNDLRQRIEQAEQSAVIATLSANGRNRNFFGQDNPNDIELQARVGDLFFRENGERRRMYRFVEVNGERYWKLETDTEDIEANKRAIEAHQQDIQSARSSADAANQQINDAINAAGFSTLADLTANIQSISTRADANALAAIDNALSASTIAQSAMTLATDLSGQVSDFELTVNGFNQTVNNYTNQVAQFTSDVNGLNSTVASYERQVDEFGNTVRTYATQVSQFENTVNGLNNTVSNFQSDVNGYQSQVATLTNTVNGFNATVQRVEADLNGKASLVAFNALKSTVDGTIQRIGDAEGNITRIEANVNGLQTTVDSKADSSTVTQLANVVDTKVSNDDYQAQMSTMANNINARVAKGELMSQINIEAGRTLIQSNRLYLDAQSVVFSGNAFIPNAAISSLSADKITAGTIDAATVNLINLNASSIVTGTLSGANMFLNLNEGVFTSTSRIANQLAGAMMLGHGRLESVSNVGTGRFVTLSGDQLHFGDNDGYIEVTPRYIDFNAANRTARMRFNGTNIVFDDANLGMNRNHINSVDWIRIIGKPGETIDTTIFNSPNHPGALIADTWQIAIGIGSRASVSRVAEFSGTINFRRNLHMNGNNIQSVSRVALDGSNTHFLSHHAQAGGVIVDSTRFTIGIGSHTSGFNDRVVVTNSQINLLAHASISGFNLRRVNRLELDGTNGHYMHLSSGSALVDGRMVTIAIGTPSSVDRVADFYGRIDFYKNLNMNGNVINNQSDARLKTNIVEREQSSLEKINAFNFVDFTWIRDGREDFGLIAQEVQQVAPELISEDSDGYLSINNSLLNMMTTHAIQELSKEHENTLLVASHAYLLAEQHEDELAELRKENQKLKERIEALEGAA